MTCPILIMAGTIKMYHFVWPKKIISFSGAVTLHFYVPHLSFYSLNQKKKYVNSAALLNVQKRLLTALQLSLYVVLSYSKINKNY